MFRRFIAFVRRLFTKSPAPEAPYIPPIDLSEKLVNGRHAEALLSDPLLNAVFESVGNRYRSAWENAPRGDLEAQRVAHLSLAALKDVHGAIRAHIGNAKILEAKLAAEREREAAKPPY